MSLTESERRELETLISVLSVSVGRQDFPRPPGNAWHQQTRGYFIGFLAGYLYLARGGEGVSYDEQREIRRIVADHTSDLRRAVEDASA